MLILSFFSHFAEIHNTIHWFFSFCIYVGVRNPLLYGTFFFFFLFYRLFFFTFFMCFISG